MLESCGTAKTLGLKKWVICGLQDWALLIKWHPWRSLNLAGGFDGTHNHRQYPWRSNQGLQQPAGCHNSVAYFQVPSFKLNYWVFCTTYLHADSCSDCWQFSTSSCPRLFIDHLLHKRMERILTLHLSERSLIAFKTSKYSQTKM